MMVVIGIIAVLSILGVTSWLSLKSDSVVENAAESVLSAINEAQNKAIAISSDTVGAETLQPKVWSLEINPATKNVTFVSYKKVSSTNLAVFGREDVDNSFIKSLTSIGTGTGVSCSGSNILYLNYSTPFGFYAADQSADNYISSGNWNEILPVGNWKLSTPLANATCITLNYQGKTRTIVIQQNGDTYVKE